MARTILDAIKFGDKVTIRVPNGRSLDGISFVERTGRATIRNGSYSWVLNMGGKYGTPAVATPENIVRVRPREG